MLLAGAYLAIGLVIYELSMDDERLSIHDKFYMLITWTSSVVVILFYKTLLYPQIVHVLHYIFALQVIYGSFYLSNYNLRRVYQIVNIAIVVLQYLCNGCFINKITGREVFPTVPVWSWII